MDNLQEIPVKDLTLLGDNPRQVRTGAIERLAKSLNTPRGRALFAKRPCLANDRDGKLIVYAGNQRLRAAKSLGWETVPCIVEKISLKEEREETIKDNLVIGQWDDDILANNFDLEELEGWGMDLKELGIEPLGDDETDEVPEPPKEARSERGKIYHLGKHRVMCGDSVNAEDTCRLMGGTVSKMIFTDPPYNIDYGASKKPRHKIRSIENDSMSVDDWSIFCHKLYEIFKAHNEGDIYMWGASHPVGMQMRLWLTEMGCHWSATIVWKKQQLVLTPANYQRMYEPCFYGWFNKSSFNGDRKQVEVWEVDRPRDSKLHPTMKPLELCQKGIQNSSLIGDVVLDLFLGSGSTLIACEQTGRICYGMEIDPKYVDVIIERFCNYTGQDKEEIYAKAG